MDFFDFQAAGLALRLRADDPALLEGLALYYQRFPKPPADAERIVIAWEGLACRCGGPLREGPRTLRAGLEEHRLPATIILVALLLGDERPDLLVFHANALWNQADGSALLLFGESGAGKSTLTALLLDSSPGWRLAAEDTTIVDPAARTILPFPRAPSIRPDNAPAGAPKRFAPPSDKALSEAVPLGPVAVVSLEPAEGPPREKTASEPASETAPKDLAEKIWATWADDALAEALKAAGLPLREWETRNGFGILGFARPLDFAERAALARTLESAGSLPLYARRELPDGTPEDSPTFARRPERPSALRLGAADGLVATLRHLRVHPARLAERPPGLLMCQIGGVMSEAAFWRLVPGGSPEESARELLRLASALPSVARSR